MEKDIEEIMSQNIPLKSEILCNEIKEEKYDVNIKQEPGIDCVDLYVPGPASIEILQAQEDIKFDIEQTVKIEDEYSVKRVDYDEEKVKIEKHEDIVTDMDYDSLGQLICEELTIKDEEVIEMKDSKWMIQAYILPDDILDTLVCDTCSNYCSVLPIKVYPNKRIRCGRCVQEGDNGVRSMYERVVKNVNFPCINRYDGCKRWLRLNEVESHENICKSRTCRCLIMTCETKELFRPLALLRHFRIHHKNQLLLDEIKVTVDNSESKRKCFTYLHRKCQNFYWVELIIVNKTLGQITVTDIYDQAPVLHDVQVFKEYRKTCETKSRSTTKFIINTEKRNEKLVVYVKLKNSDVYTIGSNDSSKIADDKLVQIQNSNETENTVNVRRRFSHVLYLGIANRYFSLSECKTKVIGKNKNERYLHHCSKCFNMSYLVSLINENGNVIMGNSACYICSSIPTMQSHLKYLLFKCRFNCDRCFGTDKIIRHENECWKDNLLESHENKYFMTCSVTNNDFALYDTWKCAISWSRDQSVVISITKRNVYDSRTDFEVKLDSFVPPIGCPEKISFFVNTKYNEHDWEGENILNIRQSVSTSSLWKNFRMYLTFNHL